MVLTAVEEAAGEQERWQLSNIRSCDQAAGQHWWWSEPFRTLHPEDFHNQQHSKSIKATIAASSNAAMTV
jgi:hypothetical protein